MAQQILSIDELGTVQTLLVKKGKGINLIDIGESEVERFSEIVFIGKEQKFAIRILQDFPGEFLNYRLYSFVTRDLYSLNRPKNFKETDVIYFSDYEKAVQHEVAFYNTLKAGTKIKLFPSWVDPNCDEGEEGAPGNTEEGLDFIEYSKYKKRINKLNEPFLKDVKAEIYRAEVL